MKQKESKLQKIVFPMIPEFKLRDLLQIIVGAAILAVPVAFTQEVWELGGETTLPIYNVLGLMALSVFFIALFTHYHYHRYSPKGHRLTFFKRVFFTYAFSFLMCAVILSLIRQAPWSTNWITAFRRTVIVTFPSSLSGTLADTIK